MKKTEIVFDNSKSTIEWVSRQDNQGNTYQSLCIFMPYKINNRHKKIQKPLKIFKESYKNKDITRNQLKKENNSLYNILRKEKLLDKAIPKKRGNNYRGYSCPLECFKDNYEKNISAKELRKKDMALYRALQRSKQLEQAIPSLKKQRNYKGDPLTFFKEKYQDKEISRGQLQNKDEGLYTALRRRNLLDIVFPTNSNKQSIESIIKEVCEE